MSAMVTGKLRTFEFLGLTQKFEYDSNEQARLVVL